MRRVPGGPRRPLRRPPRRAAGSLAAALAIAAAGCDGGEARAPIGERDSAGVAIVVSDPDSVPVEVWRVDPRPLLRLGGAGDPDGGAATELHRVAAAIRVDASIVVADAGSDAIRWFDSTGTQVAAVGRSGGGPGEFQGLDWIGAGPDGTLLAWDRALRRLTLFRDGRVVGEHSPPLPVRAPYPIAHGVLEDGTLVLTPGPIYAPEGEPGVQRPPMPVWLYDPAGDAIDTLGPFPGQAVNLRPARGAGWIRTEVPYGPSTLVAVGASEVVVGDNAAGELRVYDDGGAVRRILRVRYSPREVTQQDVEAELRRRLDAVPDDDRIRAGIRASYQETPPAAVMPAYDEILVDRTGHLWVRRAMASPAWDVFAPDGRLLGSVATPAGLRVTEIGAAHVLGVTTDTLGVEHVQLHRLERRGSRP